jgi:hypothetical protein
MPVRAKDSRILLNVARIRLNGAIKVSCRIVTGKRLKQDFLDRVTLIILAVEHLDLERSFFGKRIEAAGIKDLDPQSLFSLFPIAVHERRFEGLFGLVGLDFGHPPVPGAFALREDRVRIRPAPTAGQGAQAKDDESA